MLKQTIRVIWSVAALVALLSASTGPAAASCASLPEIEVAVSNAEVVFVGEVIETSNRQRTAVVRVEEVWKGDVADTVEIRGGPQGHNTISSVDRAFKPGERYIFFPYEGAGESFRDNACTATQRYSAAVEDLRPATVDPVQASESPEDGIPADMAGESAEPPSRSRWVGPGAIALSLACVLLVGLKLRSKPAGMDP